MMKAKYYFSALAAALMVMSACSDEDVTPQNSQASKSVGSAIVFGGRAGFEMANSNGTRTVYTGKTYEENGKKYEALNWVTGDKVQINCAQALNKQSAEYVVSLSSEEDKSLATLSSTSTDGSGSLQWNTGEHDFYSVYPAPNGDTTTKFEGTTLSGTIPMNQSAISITTNQDEDGTGNHYILNPDMSCAFMTASVTGVIHEDDKTQEILLSYKPIATVLEITLEGYSGYNTDTQTLTDVTISSSTSNLGGSFTCDLSKTDDNGYPICSLDDSSTDRSTVSVSLMDPDTQKGLELGKNDRVTLTVFMLPVADLSNLKLTVYSTLGSKSHDISDVLVNGATEVTSGSVTLKAHLKYYLNEVQMPILNANNWVSKLSDGVYLSQLSIPGSGDSYTYNYSGSDEDYYQAQTKTIQEQWNLGVRCFEITTEGASNFGSAPLLLSNTGTTFSSVDAALTEIHNYLLNAHTANEPGEFAMVIIKYQPVGSRNAKGFVDNFATYFNNKWNNIGNNKSELFRPGLTIGEVRDKMLFVLRPTSDGEDTMGQFDESPYTGYNFLIVDGWGSLQDKWKQRGYDVTYNCGHDYTTGTMEASMFKRTNTSTAPDITPLSKGTPNYAYATNQSFNAWCQEWTRVVKETTTKQVTKIGNYYLWMKWPESYSEKLADAKATFEKAIEDKKNTSSVYFNSLCGYYSLLDKSDAKYWAGASYYYYNDNFKFQQWGVTYGDIPTYTETINDAFYRYVLDKQKDITGPMGVVLMYRVGEGTGGTYMPNVVVMNNFKFPLEKK